MEYNLLPDNVVRFIKSFGESDFWNGVDDIIKAELAVSMAGLALAGASITSGRAEKAEDAVADQFVKDAKNSLRKRKSLIVSAASVAAVSNLLRATDSTGNLVGAFRLFVLSFLFCLGCDELSEGGDNGDLMDVLAVFGDATSAILFAAALFFLWAGASRLR
ncbi:MAG: hypothetical protein AAGJ97_12370 [Planctomycetota bacterium]